MRYTVEYLPNISKHAKRLIQLEMPKNMVSKDLDTSTYFIPSVLVGLTQENDDSMFDEDIKILSEYSKLGVDYIEF
jgi:hypothetical protein